MTLTGPRYSIIKILPAVDKPTQKQDDRQEVKKPEKEQIRSLILGHYIPWRQKFSDKRMLTRMNVLDSESCTSR